MRIELQVPAHDVPAAKALGARWDADRACWFVRDPAELAPLLRWIPSPLAREFAVCHMERCRPASSAGVRR